MNEYWRTGLAVDLRLREAEIPYCVIKSYCGDLEFFDGNIDIVVSDPLWEVYRRAFGSDFYVSARDRWKNRLYERNKLMLSHVAGELVELHLHSNAGWHDVCFVSAEEILGSAVELPLGGRTVRVLTRELEGRIAVLHILFEKFGKSEKDRQFLTGEDYRAFGDEYEVSEEEIRKVIDAEGAIPLADLRPIWRKYYEHRRREGAVRLRNRFLHYAIIGFDRYRSLLRRLRGR